MVAYCGVAHAMDLAEIAALKPGEFIWRPALSPRGPVVIRCRCRTSSFTILKRRGDRRSTCSSGARGHRTPTGVFTILQKRKEHYSSTYNNAPMPNMQRLTWKGIALHLGHLPGYPASHGCIRLPVRFSELVFTVTQHGTPVIIADHDSPHHTALEPGLLVPQHVADDAEAAKLSAAPAAKTKSIAEGAASSIVVWGRRKAFLMIDGEIALTTSINIVDAGRPLGTPFLFTWFVAGSPFSAMAGV